ncbi:TPA: hypothetical protein NVD24_003372 [Vibrio cholerae]|nr:hypothetical protein [Vibrio cholerae]EJL6662853.1 hypothetical protein [Vibrio cholerae]EKZ8588921.1 hypothetical protein [Vibrio cholerae]HCJ7277512.1 hypothetical protein [Vibrio cholerae]HDI3153085.1 hypothetical protein [Vibrio cholerae]
MNRVFERKNALMLQLLHYLAKSLVFWIDLIALAAQHYAAPNTLLNLRFQKQHLKNPVRLNSVTLRSPDFSGFFYIYALK